MPAFEAVCALSTATVTVFLTIPVEFGFQSPGGTTDVVLALETGEGVFASACTLSIALVSMYAVVRRRVLPKPVLLVAAVALSAAAFAVADLVADMPDADSGGCVIEPEQYFEPDLNEHFRGLLSDSGGDPGCVSRLSTNLAVPALVLLCALAGLSGATPLYRNQPRPKSARVARAALTFSAIEVLLLVPLLFVLLQHEFE
jgi:hypothetical protein